MFRLIVENKAGERFDLTNERTLSIVSIDGLTPPGASIITNEVAMHDGTRFNAAMVGERNLVLHLKLTGDVERTRINLYRFFRIKQYCKIYYQNGTRDVYCEGYVEAIDGDLFSRLQSIDISILCPSPWFRELAEISFDMSQVLAMFEFPFSIGAEGMEFSVLEKNLLVPITNSGDVDTGIVLTCYATGEVINPRIYNADTHDMLALEFTMAAGDEIHISTMQGDKYVRHVRHGVTRNIINMLVKDPRPVWFTIPAGVTNFTYDCDSGTEFFSVKFIGQNLFEGV